MADRDDRTSRGGFTLVEILIALAIVGIVVMLATSTFQGMMEKYRVEGETKQMFADLMDARARAMQRNRVFFVRITGDGYKTYEDAYDNTALDGNGVWDVGAETIIASATVSHEIKFDKLSSNNFSFNRNGIADATGFIWIYSNKVQPDYDCITVKATRIKMGQYNATDNTCAEK
jgi:prepilin-type N-terminal cleavage/methylation domain-containing protein